MKLVINTCYGGFSISRKAAEFMAARGNVKAIKELAQDTDRWYGFGYERDDADLIAAVESLGEESFGSCAQLKVVVIPDDIKYEIDEYDGIESVHEKHRSW
jgi:hypothetical protein